MTTTLNIIAFATGLVFAPVPATALSLTEMLEGVIPADLQGMGACETQATETFFMATGCMGHMQAIWDEDLNAIRRNEAQFILWADAAVKLMTSDTTFFTQGADFMSKLPPRLVFDMNMAKMRFPETAVIGIRDQLSLMEKTLTPVWQQMASQGADLPNMLASVKDAMRAAGAEGKPSVVLGLLGRHDGYHIQSWALSDPDAAAEFMKRLNRILVQL